MLAIIMTVTLWIPPQSLTRDKVLHHEFALGGKTRQKSMEMEQVG